MFNKILLITVLAALMLSGCGGGPDSPPLIYLVSNADLVSGFQSSYCWEGGGGPALCVDTIEPYFESSIPLDANAPIRLQLEKPLPNEVTLEISKEVFGDTIQSEQASISEQVEWSPVVAPGEYILSARASWDQGDVTYWFSISLE
jgi:hypothetical protein